MAFERPERTVIAFACAGHAVCHLSLLLFPGVLLAVKKEFSLSPFSVTVLPLLGYVLLGVGAVPAGVLVDRWCARRTFVLYFQGLALGCVAVAAARSPAALVVGLTLLGGAASLYHVVGLTLLSQHVRLRGRAMGIHGIAGSAGVALGSPLGMWASSLGSWRCVYLAVGALAALLGVLLLRLPIAGAGERLPQGNRDGHLPLRRFLPLLYAAMVCGGLSYRALVTVLPPFLVGLSVQRSVERSAAATLVILAVGGLGQLLGGRLSDAVPPHRLYAVLLLCAIPFSVAMAWGVRPVVLIASLLVFFLFSVQPVENNLLAAAAPPAWRGTLYGLKFAPAFGIGAFGTALVGAIWELTGTVSGVFLCVAVLLVMMASCVGVVNVLVARHKG